MYPEGARHRPALALSSVFLTDYYQVEMREIRQIWGGEEPVPTQLESPYRWNQADASPLFPLRRILERSLNPKTPNPNPRSATQPLATERANPRGSYTITQPPSNPPSPKPIQQLVQAGCPPRKLAGGNHAATWQVRGGCGCAAERAERGMVREGVGETPGTRL